MELTKVGLANYMKDRLIAYPAHQVIIHQALGEGCFIFMLVEEKLGDNLDVARADLFRLEDSNVTEQWASTDIDEKSRKNNNGTFDGPQVNHNVDYASRYAKRFKELELMGFNK